MILSVSLNVSLPAAAAAALLAFHDFCPLYFPILRAEKKTSEAGIKRASCVGLANLASCWLGLRLRLTPAGRRVTPPSPHNQSRKNERKTANDIAATAFLLFYNSVSLALQVHP